MPFDLVGVQETFQRLMNSIFGDMQGKWLHTWMI